MSDHTEDALIVAKERLLASQLHIRKSVVRAHHVSSAGDGHPKSEPFARQAKVWPSRAVTEHLARSPIFVRWSLTVSGGRTNKMGSHFREALCSGHPVLFLQSTRASTSILMLSRHDEILHDAHGAIGHIRPS